MNISSRLSTKQKWQLALTLLVLYYPVLLYIDLPAYAVNDEIPTAMIWHESLSVVVVCTVFFLWVSVSEWVLNFLFRKFGEEFLLEFKWRSQIIAFVFAFVLGMAFVIVSGNVLSFIQFSVQRIFDWSILVRFPDTHTREYWELYKRTNIGFILLIMLSSFYLIANRRANLRMKEVQLRTERLEKENSQAQLMALRNQVNPHFLFNSLSILSSLVQENSKLSSEFIHELARFYRYTLDQAKADQVPLDVEVNFIRSYLFLLDLRFSGKLVANIDLTHEQLTSYTIAPLTLQLLIENVVKHNRMSAEDPLTIRIFIQDNYLIVHNNVQLRGQHDENTGVGLKNITDRYRLLTPEPVNVEESPDAFRVSIPLMT